MGKSKIEWTEFSWNPIVGVNGGWGCNKVSPGCDHCYAEILHKRFGGKGDYGSTEHQFKINLKILEQPFWWTKPTRYFVCSTMDLFHHNVTQDMLVRVFMTMADCARHQFLVLTKRPERMKQFIGRNKSFFQTTRWPSGQAQSNSRMAKRITNKGVPNEIRS